MKEHMTPILGYISLLALFNIVSSNADALKINFLVFMTYLDIREELSKK